VAGLELDTEISRLALAVQIRNNPEFASDPFGLTGFRTD
jgi:hypothetical protein